MRVLVVEDDSNTAQSIELMLKAEGYIVDTTNLGEDGLEIGKLYDYDIIILDSPPVLAVVDSRVLSLMADATVLVVRWRRTPRVLVLQALKQLRVYGAKVAGIVITQANLRSLAASEGSHAYVHRKYGSYLR